MAEKRRLGSGNFYTITHTRARIGPEIAAAEFCALIEITPAE